MFSSASAFDQDLGWCVGDEADLRNAFDDTPCRYSNCGVRKIEEGSCAPTLAPTKYPTASPTMTPAPTIAPLVADTSTIRMAVAAWLADATRARNHISKWDTSGVTDMADLFCISDGRQFEV